MRSACREPGPEFRHYISPISTGVNDNDAVILISQTKDSHSASRQAMAFEQASHRQATVAYAPRQIAAAPNPIAPRRANFPETNLARHECSRPPRAVAGAGTAASVGALSCWAASEASVPEIVISLPKIGNAWRPEHWPDWRWRGVTTSGGNAGPPPGRKKRLGSRVRLWLT